MPSLGEIMLKREIDELKKRVDEFEKWKDGMQEWFVETGHKFMAAGDD